VAGPAEFILDKWPRLPAFRDLRNSSQFTDGSAHCLRIAVCNDSGEPKSVFLQGERAHFFVEFEVTRDIQVPSVGLLLLSDSGCVVHGKNTFLCPLSAPHSVRGGSVLRQYQCVTLQISLGKYDLSVGLGGTDSESYEGYSKGDLSYADFSKRVREHCRVVYAGSLEVGWAANGKLSHHGMADLPGCASLRVIENGCLPPTVEAQEDPMPPVFHVTHWKAGSQWIFGILGQCVPERIIEPQLGEAQVRHYAIQRGRVYPTVYLTNEELASVAPPDSKRFVVIRDLRDTLISAYFSFKHSHPVLEPGMAILRKKLAELDSETGLLHLMDDFLARCAKIQMSWIEAGEPVVRYEELLADDLSQFERILIGKCGLPIRPEQLQEAVLSNRFESYTKGRERGCEDVHAHERKGVAGDWRNHFTNRIKEAFKTRYGGLLVATGYEKDLNW
jgi:hypothetical protein